MKIKEIIENYTQHRHSVEASVFSNNIISCNAEVKKVIRRYKNGEINPGEAIQSLEMLDNLVEELIYSDYFDYMMETIPNHYRELSEDWIQLEEQIKNYTTVIKQKHGIREGIANFNSENRQLILMSNKKTTTQKDNAKNKIEKLFQENKGMKS